ncbi:hypothetical protein ILUMI_26713, partial [Ignelater luminosus]
KQAVEDADHLIVTTAIEASQSYDKMVLVAENTDILIMLAVLDTPSSNIVFLKPGMDIVQMFINPNVQEQEIAEAEQKFLVALCGGGEESLDAMRCKLFAKSLIKTNLNLASLPPTHDAGYHH